MTSSVPGKCVDLLLIGKTGNGKSALGNAILRREIFESSGGTKSVTYKVAYDFGEFNDCYLKVVDVPGVGETRLSKDKSTKLVMIALDYAIKINPEGYNAFLLVFKFGQRFKDEEKEAILFLKKIFGEDFINTFCIIVLTNGDNFEKEMKRGKMTLTDWCKQQNDTFKALLQECNQKLIVFNNVTEFEEKQNKQVADLLQMVDSLDSGGKRYTDKHFEEAKSTRDKLMIKAKEPMIRDEILRETSLIIDRLNKILKNKDLGKTREELEELSKRADLLHENLTKQDKGTGALHELVQTITNTRHQIKYQINYVKNKAKCIEENIKVNAERERQHIIKMQKLQEETERKIKEEQKAMERANKENEEQRKKIEYEFKKQQEEREKKEKEIESIRKLNEENKMQYKMEIQKLKEEADRKIKEEQEALKKANKENEEKRKKMEDEFKKQQEEQKKKEKEIETVRKLNEENKMQYKMEIQKLKEEADRIIKEEQEALERAYKMNEENRKKTEDEFKKQQEGQKKIEIETIRKQNEEKERQYKMEMQKLKEEADIKIKKEQKALEKANKEIEEKRKKLKAS